MKVFCDLFKEQISQVLTVDLYFLIDVGCFYLQGGPCHYRDSGHVQEEQAPQGFHLLYSMESTGRHASHGIK